MSQIIKSLDEVSKIKSSVTPSVSTIIFVHMQVPFRPESINQIISALMWYLLVLFFFFLIIITYHSNKSKINLGISVGIIHSHMHIKRKGRG